MSQNETFGNTTCSTNGTLFSNGATITMNYSCSSKNERPREQSMLLLPLEGRITLICIYSFIFLLGTSGNSLVCYLIGKKRERSGGDVFMMSLATADLLASFFVPILIITDLTTNDLKWYFGPLMCKILPAISPLTVAVSTWSLVLIAADRYRVIITPMKPRISTISKILGILLIWALAVGITLPYALSQELIFGTYCLDAGIFMTAKESNIYVVMWIFSGSLLPLLIISILYGLCIKKLKEGKLKEENESMKKRNAQNRKVVKMFIIIVGIFFLCTMPYSIYYVATNFMLTYRRESVDRFLIWILNYTLFVLTNVNSCINPFIYAKLHQGMNTFVGNAWKKFSCRGSRRRSHANEASKKTHAVPQNGSAQPQGKVASPKRAVDTVDASFENAALENND
eukprot:Seg1467.7 transcript_id=Seg1467.7/GoldUCD/mRNA.D3Y31 product="C3a anaphylatoxin chemotactic receptor" protein_id=Seg1467.7/GoldUCD/D3Y31